MKKFLYALVNCLLYVLAEQSDLKTASCCFIRECAPSCPRHRSYCKLMSCSPETCSSHNLGANSHRTVSCLFIILIVTYFSQSGPKATHNTQWKSFVCITVNHNSDPITQRWYKTRRHLDLVGLLPHLEIIFRHYVSQLFGRTPVTLLRKTRQLDARPSKK